VESANGFYVSSLPEEASPEDLDAAIHRISPDIYRCSANLAFRISSRSVDKFRSPDFEKTRRAILRGLRGKRLFLFFYSYIEQSHEVVSITPRGISVSRKKQTLLPAIRQAELASVIGDAGELCFLRASKGYHFLTPSHLHCTRFLRVGDAIRSVEALDTFAFWLLPHIHRANVFLADGWGIASIPLRAMQILNHKIPFDCLAEYPHRPSASAEITIKQLLGSRQEPSRLGFLVSLSITGELVQSVRNAVQKIGNPVVSIDEQVLYGFSNSVCPVPPMCSLNDQLEFFSSVETCTICSTGSKLVPIDPRLNLLRLGREDQVPLRPAHFAEGREFFERYQGLEGLLRVHRDDPNDERHHAFDIDVATLLRDRRFIERYRQQLAELGERPEVVISPNHEPGRAMAAIAGSFFGVEPITHNDLGPTLPRRHARFLEGVSHLLIVDDVLNSGSRLTTYNQSLRSRFPRLKSVSFLVGVARPQSIDEWSVNLNSLTKHHEWNAKLGYIEKVYLPRWTFDRCPWCLEYEFLSDVGELFATPPSWLDERLKRLSERRLGLLTAPLLIFDEGTVDTTLPSQALAGTQGFSAMETLFSVASALQCLRNDAIETQRLSLGFPVSNTFSIENLQDHSSNDVGHLAVPPVQEPSTPHVFAIRNLQNYSDRLLRGCLLRLVLPSEWGSAQLADLQQRLRDLVRSDGEIVAGEAILAMAKNSIPPFSRQTIQQLYSKWLGDQIGVVCDALGAR
jgi:hypothetical protein